MDGSADQGMLFAFTKICRNELRLERFAMQKIDPQRIERVARIYASNQEASRALGIAPGSFSRLCRLYEIETPYARKRRKRQECHRRSELKKLTELGLEEMDLDFEQMLEFQEELESVL